MAERRWWENPKLWRTTPMLRFTWQFSLIMSYESQMLSNYDPLTQSTRSHSSEDLSNDDTWLSISVIWYRLRYSRQGFCFIRSSICCSSCISALFICIVEQINRPRRFTTDEPKTLSHRRSRGERRSKPVVPVGRGHVGADVCAKSGGETGNPDLSSSVKQ